MNAARRIPIARPCKLLALPSRAPSVTISALFRRFADPARCAFNARTKPPIFSDLLILQDFNSPRINTYKIFKNPRMLLTRNDFNSATINTSGAKDLKSIRINTSGNKDLKSFRINTSKKYRRGVSHAANPVLFFFDSARSAKPFHKSLQSLIERHFRLVPKLAFGSRNVRPGDRHIAHLHRQRSPRCLTPGRSLDRRNQFIDPHRTRIP